MFWNIGGITQKISDISFIDCIKSYDVIGLTETWCSDIDLQYIFPDYEMIMKTGDKISSSGRLSGGILVLIRKHFCNYKKWTKITENAVFILFDRDLFGLDRDILYSCVYVQPEGSTWYDKLSPHCKNGILLFQESLMDIVSNLPDVYILCGGDYNARTGSNPDFIEDDLLDYSENQNTSYWDFLTDYFNLKRFSADRTVNNFGKTLLDVCSTFNIHIMNGRCGNDIEKGDFTYIGNNGASLIDYIISSSVLFDYVIEFSIKSRTESDHLPITLSVKTDLTRPTDASDKKVNTAYRFYWESNKVEQFRENLLSDRMVRFQPAGPLV